MGGALAQTHRSRNTFAQITARTFLEALQQGPFPQGTSACDATSVVHTDDAPTDFEDPVATAKRAQLAVQVGSVALPAAGSAALPVVIRQAHAETATCATVGRRTAAAILSGVQSGTIMQAAVAALRRNPLLEEVVFSFRFQCGDVVECTTADILRQVVKSAHKVCATLQEFTSWRYEQVAFPCMRWCFDQAAEAKPTHVSSFGSTHYWLALPSSDVDVCLVFQAGRNIKAALKLLVDAALSRNGKTSGQTPGCFFDVALEIPNSTMTWQMRFRSVNFDILGVHASRAAHRSVRSSDLMKLMMDQRKGQPGLLVGVMIFKLLAHRLNFVQRHYTSRGQKFKAIALVFSLWRFSIRCPGIVHKQLLQRLEWCCWC